MVPGPVSLRRLPARLLVNLEGRKELGEGESSNISLCPHTHSLPPLSRTAGRLGHGTGSVLCPGRPADSGDTIGGISGGHQVLPLSSMGQTLENQCTHRMIRTIDS